MRGGVSSPVPDEPEQLPPADAPRPAAPPSSTPLVHERVVVVPTKGYWLALALSLATLAVAVGFYSPTLNIFGVALYWGTVALSLIVIAIAVVGLSRRKRIIHRSVRAVRRSGVALADSVRARGDAHEGDLERWIAKWVGRFAKLGRLIFFLLWKLPIGILLWAFYTAQKLVFRILLLGYDILYYPTYAAWLVANWAVRVAVRIAVWALGVAWKVIRLPLYLPLLRTWWRKNARPKILARWRAYVAHVKHRHRMRIEKGRRLAVLRGENPDRWEADKRLRRWFPLPHPEGARFWMRKHIAHISEIQRARREGRPIPKRKQPEEEAPPESEVFPEPEAPTAEAKPVKRLSRLGRGRKDTKEEAAAPPTEPAAPKA